MDLFNFWTYQSFGLDTSSLHVASTFDSLECSFLNNECLELLNVGPDFIKWANIFYKNIESCIFNNGLNAPAFLI